MSIASPYDVSLVCSVYDNTYLMAPLTDCLLPDPSGWPAAAAASSEARLSTFLGRRERALNTIGGVGVRIR